MGKCSPSAEHASTSSSAGCAVCGDKVNGNRYGAPACLGCIVFFRRAVTNDTVYHCSKNGKCVITNESRCICRHCRLQKCFAVGMLPSAIQRRDIMGPRKPKSQSPLKSVGNSSPMSDANDDTPNLQCQSMSSASTSASVSGDSPQPKTRGLFDQLLRLQRHQYKGHRAFFASNEPIMFNNTAFKVIDEKINGNTFRRARAYDVNSMIRTALIDSAQWANQFEPFRRLPLQDKKNILTEYSFTFMMIDQGYKTSQRNDNKYWLLQNGTFMHEDYFLGLPQKDALLEQARTKASLHPLFVKEALFAVGLPMKEYAIDEYECAVLKTILLLSHKHYYANQEESISSLTNRCLSELMDYCKMKDAEHAVERFGTIILTMSSIRCIIKTVYNQTRVSDVFCLMRFDSLVKDILLS